MRVALARFLLTASSWLPMPLAHALGSGLGRLAWWIPNELRSATVANLRLCFPDEPEHARRRLAARSLQETGKGVFETGPIWLRDLQRVVRLIRATHGEELIRDGLTRGKGVIIVAPHIGCWEIVGNWLPRFGPTMNMYRPLREPGLEAIMYRARTRGGSTLVRADASGVKQQFAALRRGEMLGILPDQRPKEATAGVTAPFFGVPAPTGTLIPRLVRKFGAVAVFVFAERLPGGRGYDIHCLPAPPGLDDEDPEVAATALNRGVEACIEIARDQYVWSYRRFNKAVYRSLDG